MNNKWKKHNGAKQSPEPLDALIAVETWTAGNIVELASKLEWEFVKFYRVLEPKI